jgi:glycosyltransferase involved in cell wall biosynthesis
VIVLGDAWGDLVTRVLAVPPQRLVILRNAVPGPAAVRGHAGGASPHLLFLGQLGERKGVSDLLQALALPPLRASQWSMTLAGDGDVAYYRREAAGMGLADRVTLPGWVDGPEVKRLLGSADVLVLPSHAEGLPLAVLEGFAHGLAVVTTPVGAIPEVVQDDVNGLLVPPGDVPALADALLRVVSDAALRTRLGVSARAQWERDFAMHQYADRVAAIYAEVAPS